MPLKARGIRWSQRIAMLLTALTTFPGPSRADETIQCGSGRLEVEFSWMTATCHAGSQSGRASGGRGNTWSVSYELMKATAQGAELAIRASHAGYQSSLGGDMLGAIVALAKSSSTPISGFSSVPYEIAGFEALDYERTTGEVADGWHCTLFIRDSDPVPGGGAGFQRRVAGTFCRAPDRPLVEGELQALLTSIRYE